MSNINTSLANCELILLAIAQ